MSTFGDAPAWAYPAAPVLGYLAAGALKFAVNSAKAGRLALDQIGLGGWPSTHNTITASAVAFVGWTAGVGSPAFALGVAVAMIVAIDATDLRRKVGRHADILKRVAASDPEAHRLRSRMGHSLSEVAAGLALGAAVATALYFAVA